MCLQMMPQYQHTTHLTFDKLLYQFTDKFQTNYQPHKKFPAQRNTTPETTDNDYQLELVSDFSYLGDSRPANEIKKRCHF